MNRKIKNIGFLASILLIAGFPALASEPVSFLFHTVQKGETLQTISSHYYKTTRKWHEIFELNRDHLSTPENVEPGMTLKLKAEAREVEAATPRTAEKFAAIDFEEKEAPPQQPPALPASPRRILAQYADFLDP